MRHILSVMILASAMIGRAHAQLGDASAIAEQLFNQGRELVKANQWTDACPKFEASLRYDPLLGTRLNLAACYEHIGKWAGAWGLYRESIDLAKEAGDMKRRDYAQQQATALESRLAKLEISAPAKMPMGLLVTRDALQIEAGALGVALYVDPGPHRITASAPGFEPFEQTISVIEGKSVTLTIPDLKPTPARISGLPSIDDHDTRSAPSLAASSTDKNTAMTKSGSATSTMRQHITIGIGLAGATAISLGFLYGMNASSSYNDAKILCGVNLICASSNYEKGKQLIDDTRSNSTISTILVTTGGAAIIASIIMIWTTPSARMEATAEITPLVHYRSVGFALNGRF